MRHEAALRVIPCLMPRASSLYFRYRTTHRIRQLLKSAVDVVAEVDRERAAVALEQRFEIADRLRAAENTESKFLAGQRKLAAATAGELQEDAVVGAAFVKLSRRVQEARTVTRGRRDVPLARDGLANLRDPFVALRRFGEVFSQRDVVARFHFREQLRDRIALLDAH